MKASHMMIVTMIPQSATVAFYFLLRLRARRPMSPSCTAIMLSEMEIHQRKVLINYFGSKHGGAKRAYICQSVSAGQLLSSKDPEVFELPDN